MKLIAPATAAPGMSAPVVLGCYRLRHVVLEATAANSGPGGAGGRKRPHMFFMQLFICVEWQSTDCGGSTLPVNENLRGLVIGEADQDQGFFFSVATACKGQFGFWPCPCHPQLSP